MDCKTCDICKDQSLSASPVLITCTLCNRFFHPDCLQTTLPTSLRGDCFFSLVCSSCNSSATVVLSRGRISWLTATVLALYNLQMKSITSREGFFHWRNDICKCVNDNWTVIFGLTVKKKKTWQGSVSSCLSGNVGTLFESGLGQLKEQGWWKLISLEHPYTQMKNFVPKSNTSVPSRNLKIPEFSNSLKRAKRNGVGSLANAIALKQKRDSLSYIPTVKKAKTLEVKRKSLSIESEDPKHTKRYDDNLTYSNLITYRSKASNEVLVTYQNKHLHAHIGNYDGIRVDGGTLSKSSSTILQYDNNPNLHAGIIDSPRASSDESCLQPKLILSSCDPFNTFTDTASILENSDYIEEDVCESKITSKAYVSKPSTNLNELSVINLLGNSNDGCHDDLAELDNSSIDTLTSDGIGNSSQDFLVEMFGQIESVKETETETIKPSLEPEKEPVVNTELKSEETNFDAHILMKNDITSEKLIVEPNKEDFKESLEKNKERNILDRFQRRHIPEICSFVVTGIVTNFIKSSYSLKKLKPYIRRDTETIPRKLKIMREIQCLHTSKLEDELLHPIDFCYVQPNHIPAVNTLASLLFWPGIDVTEVLQYPDFSCVVLYKRLCIGLAFLVPDTRWNESYLSYFGVHPDWSNSGIGTFMLYHIIQTNMGKDLTLHVSASNPAVLLYQKFGFKVEEFVRDFYDKYLPEESKECKHALFLRLSR